MVYLCPSVGCVVGLFAVEVGENLGLPVVGMEAETPARARGRFNHDEHLRLALSGVMRPDTINFFTSPDANAPMNSSARIFASLPTSTGPTSFAMNWPISRCFSMNVRRMNERSSSRPGRRPSHRP